MSEVYRDTAKLYAERGLRPLPVSGKFPPVTGATGHDGTVTDEKIKAWRKSHRSHNIALRADGWIGIDVDVYGEKHGDKTLASYVERLGPLPKTYSSTARGKKSASRQYFFRVPEGTILATKLGSDIEVIQYHHRYAMVYPSVHPETGSIYRWYLPNGKPVKSEDDLPELDYLPDLPPAWLDELSKAPNGTLLDVEVRPWRALIEGFAPAPSCYAVDRFREKVAKLDSVSHIGHDDAVSLSLEGFMLGREGHSGAGEAILDLEARFRRYLEETRPREASGEVESVFQAHASIAQRKVTDATCRCGEGMDVTVLTDEELAVERKSAPLVKKNGALVTDEARRRFLDAHPVRRYADSTGVAFVWVGDRWVTTDLRILCYRWLAVRLGDDMTVSKANELYHAAIAFADIVTDDDIDSRYISCTNGLLDWRTGELRPRTPDVFVISHLPVAWRPDAHPGKFAEWMETSNDAEMIPHIWELLGYAVSPVHDLKVAIAFSGMGGGGKSTLINIFRALVGEGNTSALAPQLVGDRFNRVQLHGKLLNAAGDVGAETIRNVGVLKSIIAGDIVSAEFKGRDVFSFKPNALLIAAFNELPATESNDSGFWDRWLVVTFKHRWADDTTASNDWWRDEMPKDSSVIEGVFVEAVSALRRLRDRGSFDKRAFLPAKNEWRNEVDSVAAFAEERMVLDPTGKVSAKSVYDLYSRIETQGGGRPRNNRTFYRMLVSYLDEKHPRAVVFAPGTGNRRVLLGVKVLVDDDERTFTLEGNDTIYGPEGWANSRLRAV